MSFSLVSPMVWCAWVLFSLMLGSAMAPVLASAERVQRTTCVDPRSSDTIHIDITHLTERPAPCHAYYETRTQRKQIARAENDARVCSRFAEGFQRRLEGSGWRCNPRNVTAHPSTPKPATPGKKPSAASPADMPVRRNDGKVEDKGASAQQMLTKVIKGPWQGLCVHSRPSGWQLRGDTSNETLTVFPSLGADFAQYNFVFSVGNMRYSDKARVFVAGDSMSWEYVHSLLPAWSQEDYTKLMALREAHPGWFINISLMKQLDGLKDDTAKKFDTLRLRGKVYYPRGSAVTTENVDLVRQGTQMVSSTLFVPHPDLDPSREGDPLGFTFSCGADLSLKKSVFKALCQAFIEKTTLDDVAMNRDCEVTTVLRGMR